MKTLTKKQIYNPFTGLSYKFREWTLQRNFDYLDFIVVYPPKIISDFFNYKFGITAITLPLVVFYFDGEIKSDNDWDEQILVHELVHIKQYKKYTWLGFLIKYFYEYCRYGYFNISLEKEAYGVQGEFREYLKA